jgi:hypothetical protein
VCGGDGSSCRDCNGVVNGTSVRDACGVCGGKTADASACVTPVQSCVTVPATKKVREFESSLVLKARSVRSRFYGERNRALRSKCPVKLVEPRRLVDSSFKHVLTRSKQIFSTGVEVCGDSCITASYADQVEALMPEFKAMQSAALTLAKQVKRCYAQSGIQRTGNSEAPGVRDTVGTVNQGLRDLIERCRSEKVCPPGK